MPSVKSQIAKELKVEDLGGFEGVLTFYNKSGQRIIGTKNNPVRYKSVAFLRTGLSVGENYGTLKSIEGFRKLTIPDYTEFVSDFRIQNSTELKEIKIGDGCLFDNIEIANNSNLEKISVGDKFYVRKRFELEQNTKFRYFNIPDLSYSLNWRLTRGKTLGQISISASKIFPQGLLDIKVPFHNHSRGMTIITGRRFIQITNYSRRSIYNEIKLNIF